MHTAHNNDVNGPFFFQGVYHLFMQQSFPWVKGWNGAIGWGHMVSTDLAHWKEISSYTGYIDAFVYVHASGLRCFLFSCHISVYVR